MYKNKIYIQLSILQNNLNSNYISKMNFSGQIYLNDVFIKIEA